MKKILGVVLAVVLLAGVFAAVTAVTLTFMAVARPSFADDQAGVPGSGEAVLDGVRTKIQAGFAVLVPAGAKHNIVNTGSSPLKLYTLYSPPNHRDGVVHRTRAEAEADSEHFDGKTSE
jgi:hypothetical protein